MKLTRVAYLLYVPMWMLLIPALQAQHLNRNTVEISAGIGQRGISTINKSVFRSTLTLGYNIQLHPIIDLKLASDVLYYDNVTENILKAGSNEHFAYGIVLGSDFKLNRIIFTNGIGRYLYFNSKWEDDLPNDEINYYTKIGFRYLITKNLTAGFIMRAHRVQADYVDFGLSVKF